MLSPGTESRPQTPDAPQTAVSETDGLDFVLPSLFLSGAALILAVQDPINYAYRARPAETLALTAALVALLGAVAWKRSRALYLVASSALVILCAVAVITQPVQLATPAVYVWPLRLGLVLLVGCTWAFLLHPPSWIRRALAAFVVPSLLVLALWGGPAISAQLFGTTAPGNSMQNFGPYYLAADSHGALYASDISGNFVWKFDPSGRPVGTLSPGRAPAPPTPGPGFLPSGYEGEMNLPLAGLGVASPTPASRLAAPFAPRFEFCGLATDAQDNLYVLDILTANNYTLMRFNQEGNITARWPVPPGYEPASNCLAADESYIYLSSRQSTIHVLDHNGTQVREVKVEFQPLGIAGAGTGSLMAVGGNTLARIDGNTGAVVTMTIPTEAQQAQIPMMVTRSGEVLLTDHTALHIVRLDAENGKVLGTIGGPGKWPGQLGDVGGLAEAPDGSVVVSDYRNRVIQKFSLDGALRGVWWAARPATEGELEGEGGE